MRKLLICILVCFLAGSCDKPSKTGNQGLSGNVQGGTNLSLGSGVPTNDQTVALQVVPPDAVSETIFHAIPRNFKPAGSQIGWMINGQPVPGVFGAQFQLSGLKRGDTVQASSEVNGSVVVSNVIEIKNSPPEILSMAIMPEIFKKGDVPYVQPVARDADGDAVSFTYEWTVNGQPAGGEQRLGEILKRGDRISVKVTPFDGIDHGKSVSLDQEILNLPPTIAEHKEFSFDGSLCTYQVKAVDPDGDSLQYSLDGASNDVSIDSSSGLIKWSVPPAFKGDKNISIVVTDGHGGTARCEQKITIK
jgi:Big-like domain-containing protein